MTSISVEVQGVAATVLATLEPRIEAVDSVVALRNVLRKRYENLDGLKQTQAMLEVMLPPLLVLHGNGSLSAPQVQRFYEIVIHPIIGGPIVAMGTTL